MSKRPPGYTKPGNWETLKARVIRRDAGICYLCGQPGADTADHVLPVARGGTHDMSNLKAAHVTPCHEDKTERDRREGYALRQARYGRRRQQEPHPNQV